VNRPIQTPNGEGDLIEIYITDNGIVMFKVWHEELGLHINWSVSKLRKHYTKILRKKWQL